MRQCVLIQIVAQHSGRRTARQRRHTGRAARRPPAVSGCRPVPRDRRFDEE